MTAVRALLQFDGHAPVAGRLPLLRSCLETLTARGVDGDSLIRYGFLPEVISPLVFRRVISPALTAEERSEMDRALEQRGIDLGSWDVILGPAHPGDLDEGGAVCGCCAESVGDGYVLTGAMHQLTPVFA